MVASLWCDLECCLRTVVATVNTRLTTEELMFNTHCFEFFLWNHQIYTKLELKTIGQCTLCACTVLHF